MAVGVQLLRISTDTANMAKLATARMAKEVPGLTMYTELRTPSNLQYRKVGLQLVATLVSLGLHEVLSLQAIFGLMTIRSNGIRRTA